MSSFEEDFSNPWHVRRAKIPTFSIDPTRSMNACYRHRYNSEGKHSTKLTSHSRLSVAIEQQKCSSPMIASATKYNTCLSDSHGSDDEIVVMKTQSPRHAPGSDKDTAAEEDSPTWGLSSPASSPFTLECAGYTPPLRHPIVLNHPLRRYSCE